MWEGATRAVLGLWVCGEDREYCRVEGGRETALLKNGAVAVLAEQGCRTQICWEQLPAGHRNILRLPAFLVWGREESW